jgi:hypothetical protein
MDFEDKVVIVVALVGLVAVVVMAAMGWLPGGAP